MGKVQGPAHHEDILRIQVDPLTHTQGPISASGLDYTFQPLNTRLLLSTDIGPEVDS